MNLPFNPKDPFTKSLKQNPDLWKDAAICLCQQHGVDVTEFTPFSAGVALVAAVSEKVVIKLIQPPFQDEWSAEQWALSKMPSVSKEMGVAIPHLIAAKVDDSGWSYIIISRVSGTQLDHVWSKLDLENQKTLMHEIGCLMAFVHRNAVVEGDARQWIRFLETQKEKCTSRHRELGMPDWFTDGIEDYLGEISEPRFKPVLLTGEYTPFNLLVEKKNHEWKLSGMIDFADAFVGSPEYDLIGPGVFLGAGKPELIKALMDGYGVTLDQKLRKRLMTLHLLHRFSHFDRQVALKDWKANAKDLEELSRLLWPSL